MDTNPNLFKYATKELSQDAFLCWLLEWGDAQYANSDPSMHKAGVHLVNGILSKHDIPPVTTPRIEVIKQYKNIDILILLDDKYAILIEDKTDTKEHDDQLHRYNQTIIENFPNHNLLRTYVKTGNQSSFSDVERYGFKKFLREDILECLKAGVAEGVKNNIFIDFLDHIQSLDNDVKSYKTKPIEEWINEWNPWIGFYEELQKHLKDLEWDYVANPNGGFIGAWWHWNEWDGNNVYLQIEQGNLCFKIEVENPETRADKRNLWHERLMSMPTGINLKRPTRFGNGNYMTVAYVSLHDWMAQKNGTINLQGTLANLGQAENMIDLAIK